MISVVCYFMSRSTYSYVVMSVVSASMNGFQVLQSLGELSLLLIIIYSWALSLADFNFDDGSINVKCSRPVCLSVCLSVCLFVCPPSCKDDISKTNEPILLQIDRSGPRQGLF